MAKTKGTRNYVKMFVEGFLEIFYNFLVLTTRKMADLVVSDVGSNNSSNNTTNNTNNNNTSNLFLCDSPGCKSIFETPDKLKVHQRKLHTVREYVCNCGKAYINEGWLKKHKSEKGH